MQRITSRDNPVLKNICKLIKSSKIRGEQKIFITEGLRLCRDALISSAPVEFVCFSQSFAEKHGEDCAEFRKIRNSYLLPDALFAKICDTQTPQGILCGIKMLDKTLDSDKIKVSGKVIALENIQDPNNMGTILRTAEAFGIDCVVLSRNCCDIYSPKVVRGSMGAIFRQQFAFVSDMPVFLRGCAEDGIGTFAAVLSDEAVPVTEISFPENAIAVVGNEGNGITPHTAEACVRKIIIPMHGKAESLNAAVAASILIWEMVK